MRFLYSHRTRSADGQYVHIRELTDALRARGHDIVMAGPGGEHEGVAKDLNAGGGQWRSALPGALYELAELAYCAPAYWRLREHYSKTRPDILYQRYNLFYHPGVWLKRAKNIPLMLEVNAPLAEERARHGGLGLEGLARKSEAAIWRAADMVLPVTHVLAAKLRAAGVADEKITVIQNGASEEFLSPHDGGAVRARYNIEGKLILGFSGFVRDWHGVDRVVRAIAKHNRPDLHLLLVGDGPARAGLEALARELGIASQLTITGVVQRSEMPDHIAAFDIALQPAVTDYASPLKLFEYMALAKPILAPASANICEVLKDKEDAALFAEQDGANFNNALDVLIADESFRARLGAAARASLIRQDLTWAGNARRVEKIAQMLLDDRLTGDKV